MLAFLSISQLLSCRQTNAPRPGYHLGPAVKERTEMPVAASLAIPLGTTIVLPSLVVIILIILIIWFLFFR
jgi:hypothetical protein